MCKTNDFIPCILISPYIIASGQQWRAPSMGVSKGNLNNGRLNWEVHKAMHYILVEIPVLLETVMQSLNVALQSSPILAV